MRMRFFSTAHWPMSPSPNTKLVGRLRWQA
jgi:hypothetical protein